MVTFSLRTFLVMFFSVIFGAAISISHAEDFTKKCAFNQGNCGHTHGFVQDFGYGGIGSYLANGVAAAAAPPLTLARNLTEGSPNPECTRNILHDTQAMAGSVWNGTCKPATEEETLAINCRGTEGAGYHQPAIKDLLTAQDNLDPLQEELVFMDAVADVHKFTKCQDALFKSYLDPKNPVVRDEMIQNAFTQFTDLVEQYDLRHVIMAEYNMRERQVKADSFRMCTREVCPQGSPEIFKTLGDNLPPQIAEKRKNINALLSRIPMANRDSMRAAMENLIMSKPNVSKEDFTKVFDEEMERMNEGVQASLKTIEAIHVVDPKSNQEWYCVDRELKENLQRSGQIESTVEGLGLKDALAGFSCRSNNRYGMAGVVVSEVALIPTYFVGYGFARLGLKAGLSSVRAIASAGRTLSSVTRAAMIGLEAADWTSAMAGIERDCHSQTFFSRVEGKTCDPANEVGQVYEEASYAQCVTSVIMPFASAIAGTTVRLASSKKLEDLYRAGAPLRAADDIVVNGGGKAVKRFLSADEEVRALDSLEAKGIMVGFEGHLTLTRVQSIKLPTHERVVLIDEIVGSRLSESGTKKVLEALETGSRGDDIARLAGRQKKVTDALIAEGLTAASAEAKAKQIIESGVLGRVPQPIIRPADMTSEQELVAQFGARQATTPEQNAAYIPRALRTNSEEGTVFLNSQNSFQKKLNDSLSDKTLVDAINARHSLIVQQEVERTLGKKYPGIRIEQYSDYKAIQQAIIVPGGKNERMMNDLRKVLDTADTKFMNEIQNGDFPSIPSNLRKEPWFSSGVGETADLANIQARFPPGTSWAHIEDTWVKARILRRELEVKFGDTGIMKKVSGEVDAKIPTDEVFALLRSVGENEQVAKVLAHRHGINITADDIAKFRAYAKEADYFSPGLLIAERATHDFEKAQFGGVTLDFGGVGGLNAESVAEGLAQGFSLKRSVMMIRGNERKVTEYLDLVKSKTGGELGKLLKSHGIKAKISVSGDDMVIIPDGPLTDEIRQQIVQTQARVQKEILGETGRNTNVRVSYFKPGIANAQDRAIIAAEGEGIEKILRKKIEFELTREELRTLTIATDMRGGVRGSGEVRLITNKQLPPERLAIIEREFKRAVEEANRINHSHFKPGP